MFPITFLKYNFIAILTLWLSVRIGVCFLRNIYEKMTVPDLVEWVKSNKSWSLILGV